MLEKGALVKINKLKNKNTTRNATQWKIGSFKSRRQIPNLTAKLAQKSQKCQNYRCQTPFIKNAKVELFGSEKIPVGISPSKQWCSFKKYKVAS